ncbi:MAG: YceI family protein [Candidatus Omnitrophica bacterium]|nr:YceI family protein [Candidatus Omnitrophota bacterium]
MLILDSSVVDCFVYTYKDGLLARLAHDLKLQIKDFKIQVSEEEGPATKSHWGVRVKAVLRAESIRSLTAMKDGAESPETLKKKDHADIEKNIAEHVLKPAKFPEIVFESTEVLGTVEKPQTKGNLTLCGVTRPVVLSGKKTPTAYVGALVIHQPDFGIKPFTALMGAMKIKPEIKIGIRVHLDKLAGMFGESGEMLKKAPAEVREVLGGLGTAGKAAKPKKARPRT